MAHAGCLTPYQQAQLFTGSLPEHIRIDVELHDLQDLQRAMSLARAYKRHNVATPLALPALPPRPPRRHPAAIAASPLTVSSTPTGGAAGSATTPSSAPLCPFKRLTPAEMADCRKLGLCYNCDEPYVRGHKCPHLFYLEVTDYVVEEPDDDILEEVVAATTAEAAPFDPDTPMISLSAITGIRFEDTM